MNKNYMVFILFFTLVTANWAQTTIFTEDFNDATQYTVTLGGEGNDGSGDYFQRTDGSNISITYSAPNGSNYFAAQDVDDGGWTGSANPSELTWSSIDISGYSNLQFSGLFASAATAKIDDDDYIHVQYKIDSGDWTNLIWFENDGTQYNTYFLEDTDFDGDGDDVQLTSSFSNFTKSISLTGSSLDLKITVAVNSAEEDCAFDYFLIQGDASSSVLNPSAFSASAGSTPNDIDLSWTQNENSDNVMVAYNTTNTFGTPTDGTIYSVGTTIAGGGEVIYNGSGASYNHSSLTENTTYYYKAWSLDGSISYSSGVETNATTTKSEPTNHATSFSATANGATEIDLSWIDATDGIEPDGYLIRANKTDSFTDPVDGTDEADATDANGGTVNVAQGTGLYRWSGLDASTQYYFKIWPYTNSGSHIDYKTDGTVPTATATTDAPPSVPDLVITEIMQNPSAVDDAYGEWFEIYNNEDTDIDINGYTIKDDEDDSHLISSSVVIPTKDFIVLGINADVTTNGGVTLDYEYSGISLGNGDDEVVLVYSDGTTEVDRVNYDGGSTFPDPNGATMVLTDLSSDNNVGSNWTTSTIREGNWNTDDGDKGSPGEIGSEAVFPVELTSFTAKQVDNGILLNWNTATEVNNYGFEIQKSEVSNQNSEFTTIGFVEGHGNSNSPNEYSYFDNSIIGNISYRLKQIDFDGGTEYSEVVTVKASLAKTELFQNHPNPFNPSTQISFNLANSGVVKVSVYNALGEKVAELLNKTMEAGNHSIEFNANNYSTGLYIYRLETANYSQTKKMLLLK